MNYTIEKLLNGNQEIVSYYQKAKEHWEELINDQTIKGLAQFSNLLTNQQQWFEKNCGGKLLGQEIMAIVGLMQFYSNEEGFKGREHQVRFVHEAFINSYCSLEVKIMVDSLTEKYHINELHDSRLEAFLSPRVDIENLMEGVFEHQHTTDYNTLEGKT